MTSSSHRLQGRTGRVTEALDDDEVEGTGRPHSLIATESLVTTKAFDDDFAIDSADSLAGCFKDHLDEDELRVDFPEAGHFCICFDTFDDFPIWRFESDGLAASLEMVTRSVAPFSTAGASSLSEAPTLSKTIHSSPL